jgi:hypothetical protein
MAFVLAAAWTGVLRRLTVITPVKTDTATLITLFLNFTLAS